LVATYVAKLDGDTESPLHNLIAVLIDDIIEDISSNATEIQEDDVIWLARKRTDETRSKTR
jgi:hypothetical protein